MYNTNQNLYPAKEQNTPAEEKSTSWGWYILYAVIGLLILGLIFYFSKSYKESNLAPIADFKANPNNTAGTVVLTWSPYTTATSYTVYKNRDKVEGLTFTSTEPPTHTFEDATGTADYYVLAFDANNKKIAKSAVETVTVPV